MNNTLPIAPNGIFRTIQGEGALLGVPMIFVRLAGCSIGCSLCDTDYSVKERLTDREIFDRCVALKRRPGDWVWVTGGEPTDHEWLYGLTELLKFNGNFRVIVATAGHKQCPEVWERTGVTFLSVSPHDPTKWMQRTGFELKIVPGLNGFHLKDFDLDNRILAFGHKYVSPCAGMPETVAECVEFVESHPGWLMTTQAHKLWRMP
jgi:7-carboxy-7-deazaguanine synthase